MLNRVRSRDVRVGESYVVEVPYRLPGSRYPMHTDDARGFTQWWQLQGLRGGRFRLTVTDLDTATTPAMVEGIRVVSRSHVRVDLTLEQALELGLPPGVYTVDGMLRDVNGDLIDLPDVSTVQVPVRWLHPSDFERIPPTHRDLDTRDW